MKWLVTVCDDGTYEWGPAVVVEAAAAPEAASAGVKALADQERGGSTAWGVECQHCGAIAPEDVLVFDLATGQKFTQHTRWGLADG